MNSLNYNFCIFNLINFDILAATAAFLEQLLTSKCDKGEFS